MTSRTTSLHGRVAAVSAADPDSAAPTREEEKAVVPLFRRQRIREATEQTHGIVKARVQAARRPSDLATAEGFVFEVRSLADAKKNGARRDVRAAYLTIAASAILLAEEADRPEGPGRGKKIKSTERWRPIDFRIP